MEPRTVGAVCQAGVRAGAPRRPRSASPAGPPRPGPGPTSRRSAPSSTSPRSSRPPCSPRPSGGPREPPLPELDATDVPLVTLDPVGSRDLDQAVHLAARGGRLPGQLRDRRRRRLRRAGRRRSTPRRGAAGRRSTAPTGGRRCTRRCSARARPACCAEQLRPAVLWTIDLDADGEPVRVDLRRARVRSRAQLDYPAVQAQADAGTLPEPLALLPEIGALLQRRAAERGAIELGTPDQEVVATPDGGWTLALRGDLPVEGWNAQISLLTGRCAAALMLDGGVGVLRTLPAGPARGRRPAAAARPGARRRLAGRRRSRRGHRRAGRRPAPGTRRSSRRR